MSTTPSPPSHSLLKTPGTPINTRSKTTGQYLNQYEPRLSTLSRLALDMRPFIIGPIPTDLFLELFLPTPSPLSASQFTNVSVFS